MHKTRHLLLLSGCLLLGLLLASVLPQPGSLARRIVAGDRSLEAMAGYLPSSAHLTLFEDDDTIYVPMIIHSASYTRH